jgi:hypothetical protein
LDAAPPPPPPPPEADPPGYVYAATDIRPRQAREIELCEAASGFDWQYTGLMAVGEIASVYVNIHHMKQSLQPAVRLTGPALVGFFWGGFLSGGYLSLPKCSPTWAYGPPPEGNVRASWPMAVAITMLSAATAPVMDYTFLGRVKPVWPVFERSARVFIAMGTGALGALFPYLVPPKTWAAKKEIERIRAVPLSGGAMVSYGFDF